MFEECAVDLIGPWTVQVCERPNKFEALTAIETVTNLVKLVRIEKKNSDHITRKFAQCWLTFYPWPQCCIHDPGGEFTGPEFQTLLQNWHIRDVCITAKYPQSNPMCKRMHQMVGNVLRTLLHGEPPQDMANAKEYIDEAYPLLCMSWEQQYTLPWEVAPEVLHSAGTFSLTFLWLLIGTQSHKDKSIL
jgi:hypothetical protein